MINLNWTILIQMINFVVLILILNYVVYRPIRGILAQRKEKVEGLEDGIDRFEQDTAQIESSIEAGIKNAREKGRRMKETLEENARQEEQKMLEQINEKARQDLEEIKDRIAGETDAVRKSLQSQVEFFANEISKKMLGRAI